jgi:nicotinamidase-related amidase
VNDTNTMDRRRFIGLTAGLAVAAQGLAAGGLATVNTISSQAHTASGRTPMGLNRNRTAIVFIEFQREWLHPEGTLQTLLVKDKELFAKAVYNAESIIAAARSKHWAVVHAGLDMRGDPAYLLLNGGQNVWGLRGAIPKAGTWTGEGAEFMEPFIPRQGEFVVRGRSGASVLKHSTLDPYLRNNGFDTLVLLGFALHVCVESSLREAHDLGYNALVPTDACGVFEAEQKEYVERHVMHHFGRGCQTAELLETLERA